MYHDAIISFQVVHFQSQCGKQATGSISVSEKECWGLGARGWGGGILLESDM